MENLFLKPQDWDTLVLVLRDISKHVNCEFAIGGSIAQRALLADFAKSIQNKSLADIDLNLLGGSVADCPVKPSIKEDFFVFAIENSFNSYYFGLVHKKTKKWVDLFSPVFIGECKTVVIDKNTYKCTSIESMILYLAYDLLWRVAVKKGIKQKWIDKILLLNKCVINRELLNQEFSQNYSKLTEYATISSQTVLSVDEFIKTAVITAQPRVISDTVWSIKAFFTSLKKTLVTSNGITVDSRLNIFRKSK